MIPLLALVFAATPMIIDTEMPPCPSSPNCISSEAKDNHFIEPFPLIGGTEASFDTLRAHLGLRPDTEIVFSDNDVIRVKFTTTSGFVDDGLFVLDTAYKVIQVRSASRFGYWDFGKNRKRMKEIREEYVKCQLNLK